MGIGSTSEKCWLAACLGFAAVVGLELSDNTRLSQPASAAHGTSGGTLSVPASISTDLSAPAVTEPSADMMALIAAQPLFAVNRRPTVHQAKVTRSSSPTSRTDDLPPVELAGTLMSDQADVALIVSLEQTSQRLRVGEAILDWQVIKIDRDEIHLARDGQSHLLALRRERNDQTPTNKIRQSMGRPEGEATRSSKQRR